MTIPSITSEVAGKLFTVEEVFELLSSLTLGKRGAKCGLQIESSACGLFAWETGDNKKKSHSITHRTPLCRHFSPPMMQLELRKGHVEIFRESSSYLIPNMANKCQ